MGAIQIEYPLPDRLVEVLSALVGVAKRGQVLTVNCEEQPSDEAYGAWDLFISDPSATETIPVRGLRESAIKILCRLQLVDRLSDSEVFLLPAAFQRARYERKNRLSKWFLRTFPSVRDIFVGISFTLSVLLTIVQIVDLI